MAGALVIGGALASREWSEIKERERAHAEALAGEQAGVRITAKLSDRCSSPDQPIRFTVKNTTQRTLKSVSFHLGVYEEGRVADLTPSSVDEQWTTVLGPGAEESRCGAGPAVLAAGRLLRPEKRAGNSAVFYEKGEPVPRVAP